MHDSLRVGRVEAIGDLHGEVYELLGEERPPSDPVLQRLPMQQLQHDEALTFVVTDVVDDADVGMFERGGGPSLPFEALDRLDCQKRGRVYPVVGTSSTGVTAAWSCSPVRMR